jgi:NADH-quinone oxidoreductase subunit M
MNHLMLLFSIPFISALIAFYLPVRSAKALKSVCISLSLLPLIFLIAAYPYWVGSSVDYAWLPTLGIQFYLKVDTLSLLFLFLTAVIVPISLLAVRSNALKFPHFFYGLVLFLQGILIGFFSSRDLALFTIFWEAMLLPLYFIITIWGKAERQMAALKFLVYMIAGSALMVAAVLALYFFATGSQASGSMGTFNLDVLAKVASSAPHAKWFFAIFLLAFAVKTPLFPFHAWLPDAYYQAPTPGTILLAGLLSKAGIYGILRIGIELFPSLMKEWAPPILALAITGVLYGGFLAWVQQDFKRLIAYSSFAHVNFILVGLFIWDSTAHTGAILQALNHGITITALFLVAGWLEERLGATAMGPFSGLVHFFPKLCWLTMFFVLSSIALPGLNNFVGEVMILFGLLGIHPWTTALLGVTVILSALYMLRWMQKMYFEEACFIQKPERDIRGKEIAIAVPLIVLILWIGIYPAPILDKIWPIAEKVVNAVIPI